MAVRAPVAVHVPWNSCQPSSDCAGEGNCGAWRHEVANSTPNKAITPAALHTAFKPRRKPLVYPAGSKLWERNLARPLRASEPSIRDLVASPHGSRKHDDRWRVCFCFAECVLWARLFEKYSSLDSLAP